MLGTLNFKLHGARDETRNGESLMYGPKPSRDPLS